jgi:hypothetical protein
MENWRIQFTAKATLPDNAEKPSQAEMVKFLFETLGRKCEEIKSMYLSVSGKAIFFRCYKEETMRELVDTYDGAQFKFESGAVARVQMTQESESQKYVRVWGIPPDAPDSDVARFFGNYGEVKRIVREKYPKELNCPIETGVRGIYMDLRQEMPHFLYIRNFRIKIHYDGMKERCFGCGSTDHIRAKCPKSITPTSRMVTVEKMVNLNNLLGKEKSPSVAAAAVGSAAPEVSTAPESPVIPAITFANVVATSNLAAFAPQQQKISVDGARGSSPSPTQNMMPPVTRQQRSRAVARTPANFRDRSGRSDSSSNGSRGRPKKTKCLAIETIAKGPSSAETSISGYLSANEDISHDVMLNETTTERPPLDEMSIDEIERDLDLNTQSH